MSIPYVIEKDGKGNDKVYDLYSRLVVDRIVFVKGQFEDNMANAIVAQLLFLESVDKDADIYMYINSPGGVITSMYSVYDTMSYIKPDIVTLGMGQCASAASFILAAGKKGKRFILPNASVMIHELSTGIEGKFNDLKTTFSHTIHTYDKMAKHYAEFTGQKQEKVKKDMERDFFMSADEALKYGLVDGIKSKRD